MRELRNRCRVVLLAILLVLAGGGMAADSPRPFRVMLEGHALPEFIDPCTIQNNEKGTGHATSIGTIAWRSSETVDTCTNPDAALIRGEFALFDAAGDRITGTYNTVAHLDLLAGRVTAAGLYRIAGGTGKFANASGQGLISAEGSLAPPSPFDGLLNGTIAF